MSDDSDWLTWPQAAELVGCPVPTVEHYARSGRIVRRSGQGRHDGSLQRPSVEEFAVWWRERTEGLERRRQQREDRRIRPPEPEGWIQATEAAERLGYAHSDHVVYLARQGRLEARQASLSRASVERFGRTFAARRRSGTARNVGGLVHSYAIIPIEEEVSKNDDVATAHGWRAEDDRR
ncbi:hypothetical protein [Nocardioides lianchengensis]|uniref:hypothetical protein n=1 Tax=Nocardioides lianchengensis TaxID=1045774 RepID=UPI000B81CD2D|nr:hypothetical protein [Nocardioides lianchengensis]NYG09632.1 hypothetical protein [Nocardioides lianchengensis]